jgi:hypothetical protein
MDLRKTERQPQGPSLGITLVDGLGVENVIGSSLGDRLDGNIRDNVLSGAEYFTSVAGQNSGDDGRRIGRGRRHGDRQRHHRQSGRGRRG